MRVLAGVLLVLAIAAPAGATCPPRPGAGITVRIETPEAAVAYRTDLDRRELANLAGMAAVHDDGILGLTISRYALRASTQNHYGRTTDGKVCLWISQVDALLTIPEMTVYVAREYAAGSCEFDAVMEHEREHVRITGGLVRPFARELETELQARLAAALPIEADNAALAEGQATRVMETVMAELIARLEARRERANAHMDTEDSYRRTAAQCDGW